MATYGTEHARRIGKQLGTMLLVLSFLFIPVRCDASAAPHSIFVDPPATTGEAEHQHHGSGESSSAVAHEKHVPGHSVTPDEPRSPDRNELVTTVGADAASQAPVSSSLDLPVTTIPPVAQSPFDQDGGATIALIGKEHAALSGIAVAPDAPPPRLAV